MIKRLLAVIGILAIAWVPASAQKAGNFGGGAILGSTNGATIKYWMGKNQAIDAGLGAYVQDSAFSFYADYLFHKSDVFDQPKKGKLTGYAGPGLRIQDRRGTGEFGIRGPLGLNYLTSKQTHPVELFVELAPVILFNGRTAFDLDGMVGLRYYFFWK